MGEIIKIKCNGAGKHVNEVDFGAALVETTTLRIGGAASSVPERVVLRCNQCADGKVILTRAMIEDARRRRT